MRAMMKAFIPVKAGNKSVKDGSLQIDHDGVRGADETAAAYFVAENGKRTAIFFFDLKDLSTIPIAVEPFFLNLNASTEMTPAMNVEDLKAGVQRAMKAT